MKTYISCSQTNYDLLVHIVNADTIREAYDMAIQAGAWENAVVHEIDTKTKGVVFTE